MGVGTEIRAEMARRSVTGVALAEATGLKRPYLSQRLNEHADLRVGELRKIGAALGIAASTLLKRAEQAEAASAVGNPPATHETALAGGPSRAELEAHAEACDVCTSAEDALEHAREQAGDVA